MAASETTTPEDFQLARLIDRAAGGSPPPADGDITVIQQRPEQLAGILAFGGHHVVLGDVDPNWVFERLERGDMSSPVGPAFVGEYGAHLGRSFDNLDLVFAGGATDAPDTAPARGELVELEEIDVTNNHPRVDRALRYRTAVRAFATPDRDGVLVIGRGLARRWEASFEVEPHARNRGLGRMLATAAMTLVPSGAHLFVQVAPGNVASLRAVIATGLFYPIGAEILFPSNLG